MDRAVDIGKLGAARVPAAKRAVAGIAVIAECDALLVGRVDWVVGGPQ